MTKQSVGSDAIHHGSGGNSGKSVEAKNSLVGHNCQIKMKTATYNAGIIRTEKRFIDAEEETRDKKWDIIDFSGVRRYEKMYIKTIRTYFSPHTPRKDENSSNIAVVGIITHKS